MSQITISFDPNDREHATLLRRIADFIDGATPTTVTLPQTAERHHVEEKQKTAEVKYHNPARVTALREAYADDAMYQPLDPKESSETITIDRIRQTGRARQNRQ